MKYSEIYTSTKHTICTIMITTSWIWCLYILLYMVSHSRRHICSYWIWYPVLWHCNTWHHIP